MNLNAFIENIVMAENDTAIGYAKACGALEAALNIIKINLECGDSPQKVIEYMDTLK